MHSFFDRFDHSWDRAEVNRLRDCFPVLFELPVASLSGYLDRNMRFVRFINEAVEIVSRLGCSNNSHDLKRAQLRTYVNFFAFATQTEKSLSGSAGIVPLVWFYFQFLVEHLYDLSNCRHGVRFLFSDFDSKLFFQGNNDLNVC